MSLAPSIKSRVHAILRGVGKPDEQLNNALRLLSKWRSVLIQNTLLQREGTIVRQGPLKGLDFIRESAEGCHVAKLLGTYEQPLQPYIESAIDAGYSAVINIGCAEGYYAVGLARRMPEAVSYAYDIDENAQRSCAQLAEKNGVRDRVVVRGQLNPDEFASYSDGKVLVFCDIEGAEESLLDPAVSPSLAKMDIIVEAHECLVKGVTDRLIERFSRTHRIHKVEDLGTRMIEAPPEWFTKLSHLDQLLATWEWRSGPTPWLVMTVKEL